MLMKKGRPLTIDQVLKLSRGKLAQSTLYRVINDLKSFGLINEFNTPDKTIVVELNSNEDRHHHHIFCNSCGAIIDIQLNAKLENDLDNEVREIERNYSLKINSHSLELFGVCGNCRDNSNEVHS